MKADEGMNESNPFKLTAEELAERRALEEFILSKGWPLQEEEMLEWIMSRLKGFCGEEYAEAVRETVLFTIYEMLAIDEAEQRLDPDKGKK